MSSLDCNTGNTEITLLLTVTYNCCMYLYAYWPITGHMMICLLDTNFYVHLHDNYQ